MKKLQLLVAFVMMGAVLWAQDRGTAEVDLGGGHVVIDYGRPSLAGRDMLGRLPAGRVWRMGMNSPTILKTDMGLSFGDQTVDSGQYRLWARKTDDGQWELIINSGLGRYDASANVAVVPLRQSEQSEKVEVFTIELEAGDTGGGVFTMMWDELKVSTSFSVSDGQESS